MRAWRFESCHKAAAAVISSIRSNEIMAMNEVTHIEWATTELDTLRDFLQGMFGWQFSELAPIYYFAGLANLSIGLLLNPKAVLAGGSPNVYITVEEIDRAFDLAVKLGGEIAFPKVEVPEFGWYGFVKSPDGNLVGLHQHKAA
jgi:predicted enzyme related to lactoylglutathione lyase